MSTQSDRRYLYGDGIGSVQVIGVLGDEYTPAEDARTSTGKGRQGPEKDAKLQDRLMRDRHTSPFEGVLVKVEMVLPLFVLREVDRHRTLTKVSDVDALDEVVTPEEAGRKWFSRSEMSGRYVQLPAEYYFPDEIRGQSTTNQQGDEGTAPAHVAEEFQSRGRAVTQAARELYDWAVQVGIEKGQARIFNTMNQYTRIRMTGSIKNWLDWLQLRMPSGVLWECRRAAEELHDLLWERFPSVLSQWSNNVRLAVALTVEEQDAVRGVLEKLTETGVANEDPEGVTVYSKLLKRLREVR